jgi:hypothetical protein
MNVHTQSIEASVRFSRWVFLLAGVIGLFELVPLYFYEPTLNRTQPPALTHPEFYYGFLGVAVAWQIAFLIMSRDPQRYQPLLPALFLEKLLYPLAAYVLYARGRVNGLTLAVASADLVWLALFVAVWARTTPLSQSRATTAV